MLSVILTELGIAVFEEQKCIKTFPFSEPAEDYVFVKKAILPKLSPGDLIAIYSAGAYGALMSSEYNTRPLIPELMVKGNISSIIRARPTLQEVIDKDQIPYWLR